jgi:hypothetical protein
MFSIVFPFVFFVPFVVMAFDFSIYDGVAKTHQLLRCCNCSRHCGVPKYASFLDHCAPCIWRFLLSHSLFGFLAKASLMTLLLDSTDNQILLFGVIRFYPILSASNKRF